MKKFTRSIGALNIFKRRSTTQNPVVGGAPVEDRLEPEDGSLDAFYQRMFVGVASQNENRDIYLHVSEVSVAMIGVCLTGVSILNVDQDINSLDTYVDDLLAIA